MSKDNGNTNLSDNFKQVEAERETAIETKRIDGENKELVVFFHVAKKGQLGGRSVTTHLTSGKETQRDNPVRFDENIRVTSDKDEIEFIRNHDSFGIHCFECKDMDDANVRRAASRASKQDRQVSVDLNIQADGRNILTAE